MRYIALLRGVNVGGKNKLPMPTLKAAFEQEGFTEVASYINSGNLFFSSGLDDPLQLRARCEGLIAKDFALEVPVAVFPAQTLVEALAHAPGWWGGGRDSAHNAIFVMPPATMAEIFAEVGEAKPEYEQVDYYGPVIFWSAPLKTFSRTRLSKVVGGRARRNITIRNANTARRLAELARGKGRKPMETQGYEVVPIDEGSWRIEENGVRCFLFAGRARALLVDSGFGGGDLRAVVAGLTALPVTLVNTHADRDHTGANQQFGEAYMHPAEYDRYRGGREMPMPARPLWEGDVIELGGRRFEALLLPGHTPGSLALLDIANGVLIGGDGVQDGNIFMFGPGRNLPAYLASMEKLAGLRGRFDTVYPSHGSFPVTPGCIDGLIAGARQILAGELAGAEMECMGTTVRVFDVGVAKFLCDA